MIQIIIVDDHKMFREGLKKMFQVEGFAKVIGEASNGKEFLSLLDNLVPDVVMMDISMPEMDGIEATKLAIEKNPDIKILTLSSFGDESYYYTMIEAGVKGFVLKSSGIIELMQAIKEVAEGGSWFSNLLLRKVISTIGKSNTKEKNQVGLSDREMQVLKLVCEGLINEQISSELNITTDTVKYHRSNILSKTGTPNTAALVMFAIKNKLIEV